ncbi:MAG: hypothetical protein VKJ66_11420 [Synechococcus sp.]|nr:hypothetical protein [Synechococcus sp.]
MPRHSSATPKWVTTLRQAIKATYGQHWSIKPQSNRVKLVRRFPDGKSSAVTLGIPWNQAATTPVLTALEAIARSMGPEGLQMTLAEAAVLAEAVAPQSPAGAESRTTTRSPNWHAFVERFHQHKVHGTGDVKESTWARMYAPVMDQVLDALSTKPIPRDGPALLSTLRDRHGGEPGSRGRQQRLQYTAQLLAFVVKQGAPQRWAPPANLSELVGRRQHSKPDSTPLLDHQLSRLLEGIPDGRWRLAVGLIAVFGLRPVELRYCRASNDLSVLEVSYRKRTSRGSTEPRKVRPLDPEGMQGLGERLLAQLHASSFVPGLDPLPPLGTGDGQTAQAVAQYLRRRLVWRALQAEAEANGEHLTVYSLRHGYALRAHQHYELTPRITAALMGHSLQTHSNHYGQWTDDRTVAEAVALGRNRALQKERAEAA